MSVAQARAAQARWQGMAPSERVAATEAMRRAAAVRRAKAFALLEAAEEADVLRCGGTEAVLPFRMMAPSTLDTFLRAFTFGNVRQLEAVVG